MIISKITPYQSDRYIAPIFPFILLLSIGLILSALDQFKTKKIMNSFLVVSLCILHGLFTLNSKNINYLYSDTNQEILSKIHSQRLDGVLIYNPRRLAGAQVTKAAQDLINHSNSYILNDQDFVHSIVSEKLDLKPTVVYFGYNLNPKDFLLSLTNETNFSHFELLDEYSNAYLLK